MVGWIGSAGHSRQVECSVCVAMDYHGLEPTPGQPTNSPTPGYPVLYTEQYHQQQYTKND